MGTPKDWKNVEITLYAKVNDVLPDQEELRQFVLLARGGHRHTEREGFFGGPGPCEGTAYEVSLRITGHASMEKELFHGPSDNTGYSLFSPSRIDVCCPLYNTEAIEGPTVDNTGEPPIPPMFRGRGRWFGMKGIFLNIERDNEIIPRLELWVDKHANNDWENLLVFEDKGDSGV